MESVLARKWIDLGLVRGADDDFVLSDPYYIVRIDRLNC